MLLLFTFARVGLRHGGEQGFGVKMMLAGLEVELLGYFRHPDA